MGEDDHRQSLFFKDEGNKKQDSGGNEAVGMEPQSGRADGGAGPRSVCEQALQGQEHEKENDDFLTGGVAGVDELRRRAEEEGTQGGGRGGDVEADQDPAKDDQGQDAKAKGHEPHRKNGIAQSEDPGHLKRMKQ